MILNSRVFLTSILAVVTFTSATAFTTPAQTAVQQQRLEQFTKPLFMSAEDEDVSDSPHSLF